MKLIALLALLVLIAPCIAMSDTQAAYLQGFADGMNIMDLYRENVTAYNIEAAAFNASLVANLNESEGFMLPLASPRIAPVPALFDPDIAIEDL